MRPLLDELFPPCVPSKDGLVPVTEDIGHDQTFRSRAGQVGHLVRMVLEQYRNQVSSTRDTRFDPCTSSAFEKLWETLYSLRSAYFALWPKETDGSKRELGPVGGV